MNSMGNILDRPGNAEAVLRFEQVSASAGTRYDGGVSAVDLTLTQGECLLIKAERQSRNLPLADLAEGLLLPDAGTVFFCGNDWNRISPDQGAGLRGRIGRVFEGQAWVSNLDVDENITLRLRHHDRRPVEAIEEEAQALAERLGLGELPRKRPAWVSRYNLQRAQWVRALLGTPDMLLLCYPELHVPETDANRLAAVLMEYCEGGGAVVWFTINPHVWDTVRAANVRRFYMQDDRLEPAEEGQA
jgi:ABC-type lipoprotein export system ATPase subunit